VSHRIEDDKWHSAFWVSNRYQSEGYATEAVSTLTERLPFKFRAGAAIWNKASNRVLLNCGFKRTGTNENGYTCKGKIISIYEYEKV
jgi:RimJ/RimL family protein N-acetyltransferase